MKCDQAGGDEAALSCLSCRGFSSWAWLRRTRTNGNLRGVEEGGEPGGARGERRRGGNGKGRDHVTFGTLESPTVDWEGLSGGAAQKRGRVG